MRTRIKAEAKLHSFFHWHLEFPDVFEAPEDGFDVILGNPPWERVNLKEKEWFAQKHPEIANAPNSAVRKRLIEGLRTIAPSLFTQFAEAVRQSEGAGHFLRSTGLYPLCGRGDINLYAVFAESMRNRLNAKGRAGAIIPSGIATDELFKVVSGVRQSHSDD